MLMRYCTLSSYSLSFLVACIHWFPDTPAGCFLYLFLTPQLLQRGMKKEAKPGQKTLIGMGIQMVVLLVSQALEDIEAQPNRLLMRI